MIRETQIVWFLVLQTLTTSRRQIKPFTREMRAEWDEVEKGRGGGGAVWWWRRKKRRRVQEEE